MRLVHAMGLRSFVPISEFRGCCLKLSGSMLRRARLRYPRGTGEASLFEGMELEAGDIDWCLLKPNPTNTCLARRDNGLLDDGVDSFAARVFAETMGHEASPSLDNREVDALLRESMEPEIVALVEGLGMDALDLSADVYNWLAGAVWPTPHDDAPAAGRLARWLQGLDRRLFGRVRPRPSGAQSTPARPPGARRDPALADLRRQAMRAYPLLPLLLPRGMAEHARRGNVVVLDRAVRERAKLSEAFKEALGAPAWAVRRLNGLRPCDVYPERSPAGCNLPPDRSAPCAPLPRRPGDTVHLWSLLAAANDLKPEHYPTTPWEWDALNKLERMSGDLLDGLPPGVQSRSRSLIRNGVRGKWAALDPGAWSSLDARDVENDLVRNLLRPVVGLEAIPDLEAAPEGDGISLGRAAKHLLWADRALPKIIESSRWWHERRADILRRLTAAFPPEGDADLSWEKLCEDFTASNGHRVVAMTDSRELRAESDHLRHCVAGYDHECAYDGSHILGVRDARGHRVSTAEIKEQGMLLEDPMRSVRQHRAALNAAPPRACEQALEEWCAAVSSRRLAIDLRALGDARQKRASKGRKRRAYDHRLPAYDASSRDACQAAWHEYAPLLPRDVQKAGPFAFAGFVRDLAQPSPGPG